MSIQVSFACPGCGRRGRFDVADDPSGAFAAESAPSPVAQFECSECGWANEVKSHDLENGHPVRCLACGNHDLWRQKNFPPGLGLAVVAAGAALSSVAWYFHRPILALGVLMAFALADMVLFFVMSDVLVCYRCRARHGGTNPDVEHPAFDHETAERYRQERLRLAEADRANPV
ncbi:MAG: hypothetical protein DWQ34_10320 [Planctomycetota bacterium]|nr:MAG: hypothetical protein DWQ29_15095 [Planctomycetota bacterium]REJ93614.1 MAG: hypothetical protein DWQ34_10320 [Planctomycetota bacterium]REK19926.1 MAG: hypothetical protein DWQ41_26720 [Planctomycetota bacterium]REK27491.1 MAG: hypothetical protein DWQ45_25735 [Planctomycetota bacterium]